MNMELTCFDCNSFENGICLERQKFRDENGRVCSSFTDYVSKLNIDIRSLNTLTVKTCKTRKRKKNGQYF